MGYIEGLTLKRHTKKNKKREDIFGLCAERDYMKYLNSVENNYHEISLYLTTIRKIRYCLRILFWSQERVFHTLFVVVCYISKLGIGTFLMEEVSQYKQWPP